MPPARKSKDKEYASARRRRSEQEAAARAPAEDRDAAREAAAARRSAALALAAERCGETVPGRETVPSRALVAPQNAVSRRAPRAKAKRSDADAARDRDAALFALDAKGSTALHRFATRASAAADVARLLAMDARKLDVRDSHGDTAVHAAAATDAVPCLRLLLDAGADATARNAQGFAPLALAASRSASRAAVVLALELEARGLVAAGALDAPGGGYAPLHWACVNDLPDAAATLAARGADAGARSHPDGETPLVKACRYGHGACALALLEHAPGLDLDAAGADGATALIHAARFGCCESVDALVGRGADVRAADGDGRTALGYATRGGHLRCAHALAMAGALRAPPPPAPAAAVADHWSGDRAAPAGGTVVDRFFYKLSFPMARPEAAPPPAPPRPPRADLD